MNITIIGCGWLGQQLGTSLIENGHTVRGNFRSAKTEKRLMRIGIKPFRWEVSKSASDKINQDIIDATDILIICLPPSSVEDYPLVLQNIVLQFEDNTRVIFTSSTSVYPMRDGVFDEMYEFNEQEKKSRLFRAEKGLTGLLNDRLTILRLGGLIGPNRHPVKYVSGKTYADNGLTPINLIDSRDICRLVNFLLQNEDFGRLFNVVCPSDKSKRSYYTNLADELALQSPEYGMNKSIQRIVKGDYITNSLGFEYKFDVQKFDTNLLFV